MRRSGGVVAACTVGDGAGVDLLAPPQPQRVPVRGGRVDVDLTGGGVSGGREVRSEEHTSELQSRENLVCRLLLEKKNRNKPKLCVATATLQLVVARPAR